jgi:hypothetical protein
MVSRGRNINFYLMDGEPTGRIKVTLANWTGVTYRIPRTELDRCKGRDDLAQSGVYFLFGTSEDSGKDVVYIGQAGARKNGEGILYRLMEHKRNPDKNYWTETVVFTTSNNSFGPTEISYLENRFCNLASEAKRYIVKNGNEPSSGNITEEKESELEEFIDNAKIVMGTLGHKVFEKLVAAAAVDVSETKDTPEVIFEIKQGVIYARGQRTPDGFVIFKGSKIKKQVSKSLREAIKILRERYDSIIGEDGVLQEDILFKSPNEAANFSVGYPINARDAWKTADFKTLKDVEIEESAVE